MPLPPTRGNIGRNKLARAENPSECRVVRAAGAKVRIYRGNHCVLSWLWKLLTTTCRETASAIPLSFADGDLTRSLPTVPMRSWRLFPHKNWRRFFPTGANSGTTLLLFPLLRLLLAPFAPFPGGVVIG